MAREERMLTTDPDVETWFHNQYAWFSRSSIRRKTIDRFVERLNRLNEDLAAAKDSAVVSEFQLAIETVRSNRSEEALMRALACVGDASRRVLGKQPYGVQFFGAFQLIQGRLVEMQTGEGKSLVAALAAGVIAGSGAQVHVISVNDYLSARDCQEMGPLFNFFGLKCSFVHEGMERRERFEAYRSSVCYVSGKELVFDDLKDRMAGRGRTLKPVLELRNFVFDAGHARISECAESQESLGLPLIPALHYAIIDEADSILIDEAKTPMILSRNVDSSIDHDLWHWAIAQSRKLVSNVHFRILAGSVIQLLDRSVALIVPFGGVSSPIWQSIEAQKFLITQALLALHVFVKDQHYIIADAKICIVDESTGRLMPDRSWEQGLHQLIEAKEGLAITDGRETFARMTFQRFFRHYYLVSGLSGTIAETSREIWLVYRLKVVCLPPHKVSRRQLFNSIGADSVQQKWDLVTSEVKLRSQRGQPVLVGTRSVQASEQVSVVLKNQGLEHVVLNARQTQDEAEIVAMAGQCGKITVATNMAGRGTDIKLDEAAYHAGGLHVILTEYHESARVDRQLFGRAGRQGDPGSGIAIVCSEDRIFARFAPRLTKIWSRVGSLALRRLMMEFVRKLTQWRAESIAKESRLNTLKQDQMLQSLIGVAGERL